MNSSAALKHDLYCILGNIDRNDLASSTGGIEEGADLWHLLFGLDIIVIFVGEAAHQTATDTRDF